MSLGTGLAGMNNVRKTLKLRWEEVRLHWNDAVQRDFEENVLNPLDAQLEAAHRALDRLAVIMAQALQDTAP